MTTNNSHMTLLKQGVDHWNQWRVAHPAVKPELSYINLSGAYLVGANLREADLRHANLSHVNLKGASLIWADLSGADLSGDNLKEADLTGANLSGDNLKGADLSRDNLREANLSGSDLTGANLSATYLRGANLAGANLTGANLNRANLRGANLTEAYLEAAHLNEADLRGANLTDAYLGNAKLIAADLRGAQAFGTNFAEAELTGAYLEDWQIDSATHLEDVICEYVYQRPDQQERCPPDPTRIFVPGEFTQHYQKTSVKFELIFHNGIDWRALYLALQDIQHEYEERLGIQAIEHQKDGVLVIRLDAPIHTNRGAIMQHMQDLYQTKLVAIEEQYRSEYHFNDEKIAQYRCKSTDLTEIVRLLANRTIKAVGSSH